MKCVKVKIRFGIEVRSYYGCREVKFRFGVKVMFASFCVKIGCKVLMSF